MAQRFRVGEVEADWDTQNPDEHGHIDSEGECPGCHAITGQYHEAGCDWEPQGEEYDDADRLDLLRARIVREGGTFDYALPQPWLDGMAAKGYDYEEARVGFVWAYLPPSAKGGRAFGEPYPVTNRAAEMLAEINEGSEV